MKQLPLLISAILFFSVFQTANAQFAGGDGTEQNPWQISTIEQLDSVRYFLDDHFELTNDLNFTGSIYDSINSQEGWIPIGTSSDRFTGSFNGKGFVIENLYINKIGVGNVSLFGYIYSANLDSLSVLNCNVLGGSSDTGCLVSVVSNSTISSCTVSGRVSGYSNVGSIAGNIIDNSSVILCKSNSIIEGHYDVGGLFGSLLQGSRVEDCTTAGSVSGVNNVGGLIGIINNGCIVNNCESNNEVEGSEYVGGFAGKLESSTINRGIVNCHVLGTDFVGGFTGICDDGSTIEKCYAIGSVQGADYVGGLAGSVRYNSTVKRSYVSTYVVGYDNVGGFIGELFYLSNIYNCYATGQVEGGYDIGGFIGYNSSATGISCCYSANKVVSVGTRAGGFIGFNFTNDFLQDCYYNVNIATQQEDIGNNNCNDTIYSSSTVQMQQASYFSTFNFDSIWGIDNGLSFPFLQGLDNYPIIYENIKCKAKLGELFIDTIQIIGMGNVIDSVYLVGAPDGMTIINNSLLVWTPVEIGFENFSIEAIDQNGNISTKGISIEVVPFWGLGTIDEPYEIWSIADLDSVRFRMNECYILMADLFFSNSPYDSLNNQQGWVPIGDSYNHFTGYFDGNNHSISELYVNTGEDYSAGLFGVTNTAEIVNINLKNCTVFGNHNTGCLVGCALTTTFKSCYVSGNSSGIENIGGLLGFSTSNSKIESSSFRGKVVGIDYVGGFVGKSIDTDIEYSFASANVRGNDRIGGFIGDVSGSSHIFSSYANGTLEGIRSVGGFCGVNTGNDISCCYASVFISGNNRVGGFVGEHYSESRITHTYSASNVMADSQYGSFAGYNIGNIDSSYYQTEIGEQLESVGNNTSVTDITGLNFSEMKTPESYNGFDFDSIWSITTDYTFPRFQAVYDLPIILPNLRLIANRNILYEDTIQCVKMDYEIDSIWLDESPLGMELFQDSIIRWTPDTIGFFDFTINVKDINGQITSNIYNILVVPYAGSGTIADPYQIYTIEDLDNVRYQLGEHFILMSDIDFAGTIYDSITGSQIWDPIGNFEFYFYGSFNGNDHTIHNFYTKQLDLYSIGLFGCVGNAEIYDLSLRDCNVIGGNSIGALIGTCLSSNINNCKISGRISGQDGVGGLVGRSENTNINQCEFSGSVSGEQYTGGILGHCSISGSHVKNCYTSGVVTGKYFIAGLVGASEEESTISNSYSLCDVIGSQYVGGLLGLSIRATINNCFAAGEISGLGYVGGIIGKNTNYSSVNSCYSYTKVSEAYCAGAIIGRNDGGSVLNNCYYNTYLCDISNGIGLDYSGQSAIALDSEQMKQISSFSGFDFDTVWIITDGHTFPRLRDVFCFPIVQKLNPYAKVNNYYNDTIKLIQMDGLIDSIYLKNSPENLVLTNDTIASWTPNETGKCYANTIISGIDDRLAMYRHGICVYSFEGGGTEALPYQITNVDELNQVRFFLDKHFILMNDLDLLNSPYDSTNCNQGWSPIGSQYSEFTGNFNGNSHVIRNLYINQPERYHIGLFGNVESAKIYNLGLNSATVISDDYSGILVGYGKSFKLDNCYTQGLISGVDFIGGLVGMSDGGSIISQCYSTSDIYGHNFLGGLVGRNDDSDVLHSYSTGTIHGQQYLGGLIGENRDSSNVANCYSTSRVFGYTTLGGLVGENDLESSIFKSYVNGYVYASIYPGAFLGHTYTVETIEDCFFNSQLAEHNDAISSSTDTLSVKDLSIDLMKNQDSFENWNFDSIWQIRNDTTFPGIQNINNSPFAMRDSLYVVDSFNLSILLDNDYDIETLQNNLVYYIESIDSGYIENNKYYLPESNSTSNEYELTYRVGEVQGIDTLWGSHAKASIWGYFSPVISPLQTFTIEENALNGTLVDSIEYNIANGFANEIEWAIISGNEDSIFGIQDSTGFIFIENNELLDFENNSNYSLELSMFDGLDTSLIEIVNINIIDVNDNVPFILGNQSFSVSEAAENETSVGTIIADDNDSNTNFIDWTITSGNINNAFSIDSLSGEILVLDSSSIDFETGEFFHLGITVGDGVFISLEVEVVISVINVNDNTPVITENLEFEIDENAANHTSVGIFTAFDIDQDSLSDWNLVSGDDNNTFSLDSESGELIVNNNQFLDFESTQSYSLLVTVSDGNFTSETELVTVNVNDLNDNFPAILSTQLFQVSENATDNTTLGYIVAMDNDLNTSFTNWNILSGNEDGIFSIDSLSGELNIEDNANLDYEILSEYYLEAVVTDGLNLSQPEIIEIEVLNENDNAPVILPLQEFSIDEDIAEGTSVGYLLASDPDLSTEFYNWSIVNGNEYNIFSLNSSTGEIIIQDNMLIDFEEVDIYNLTITVTDGLNTSAETTITINVNDLNDNPPTITQGLSYDVSEDSPDGYILDVLSASDVDLNTSLVGWEIIDGNNDGIFSLNFYTGQLSVFNNEALDFEQTQYYDLSVVVGDGANLSDPEIVHVSILDVNDNAPVIEQNQVFSVLENSNSEFSIGHVTAFDNDEVSILTDWAIVSGNVDNVFQISETTGELIIMDTTLLDYETRQSYTLEITVSDGLLISETEFITINILDVNDNPPIIPDSQLFTLEENSENETSLGFVLATDVDENPEFTAWSIISGNEDDTFLLDESTGELKVLDNSLLDFETVQSFGLLITVSDGMFTSETEAIVIELLNENDCPPVINADQSFSVDDNAANETIVGNVLASDLDGETDFTDWSITSGNEDFIFGIQDTTGRIYVMDNTNLDFDISSSYVLMLIVSDGENTSEIESVTININDCSFVGENDLNAITIYPNPVNNKLFIEHSNVEISHYELLDYQGKRILSQNYNSSNPYIDVSSLKQGAYLLKLICKNGNVNVFKVVKNQQ